MRERAKLDFWTSSHWSLERNSFPENRTKEKAEKKANRTIFSIAVIYLENTQNIRTIRKFWNKMIRDSPYTLNGMLAWIE